MSEDNKQFGYEEKLKRALSFRDVLVYGLLFISPIAPITVFGFVFEQSNGMVPLIYLVGIICMLFTAISYSRFSKKFPIAGSVYSYVQRGVNPHVGFIGGWTILLDYIVIPSLVYAFVPLWLKEVMPGVPSWIWIVAFVLANTAANLLGVKTTARTSFVFLGIQLIMLVIFVVLSIAYIVNNDVALTISPLYQPGKIDLKFIAMATSIAVMSFLGFDGISTLAEETKNPEKTIGKATILTLIITGLLFMLQTYLACLIMPTMTGVEPATAFFTVAAIVGGETYSNVLLAVIIVIGGIASGMVAQSAVARIIFSISRDKLLPQFFSKVHPKFQTPYVSILFVAAFSLTVAVALDVNHLITLVNFGALTSFMLLNFAVFWLFFIKEKNRGPNGIFNYIVLPFLGLGIISYVWWGFDNKTKIMGLCWMLLGIIIGFIKSKGYKELPDVFKNVEI